MLDISRDLLKLHKSTYSLFNKAYGNSALWDKSELWNLKEVELRISGLIKNTE
jgi:hypothetical protein